MTRREEILNVYTESDPKKWTFHNSFTPVLLRRFPYFGALLSRLQREGAAYANISGSGSAIFGIFTDEKTAKIAQKALKTMAKNVWKLK